MIGERKYPHLWDEQMIRAGLSEIGSVAGLARRLGCNYQTLYAIMGKLGIQSPRPQVTGRSLWQLKSQAVSLYKQGLSTREIAARVGGVTRHTIANWLRWYEIPMRERGTYTRWRFNNASTKEGRERLALIYEVVRLRCHEKMTWREVADRFGHTVNGCRKCAKTAYGEALAKVVFTGGSGDKISHAKAMREQGVDVNTIMRALGESRFTIETWVKAIDTEYWKCPIP